HGARTGGVLALEDERNLLRDRGRDRSQSRDRLLEFPAHGGGRRIAPLLREQREGLLGSLEKRRNGRRHAADRSRFLERRRSRPDGRPLRSVSRIVLLQRE